ncbi:MAG: hypothetical protein GC200_10320 [Tepidisphaera sp.]|nr:hypothetical protein [Tepidisphaera sp.]
MQLRALIAVLCAAGCVGVASAQVGRPATPDALSGPKLAPDGGYHLEVGPYKVNTTESLVLHDAKRNKDLTVKVRVPVPTGPGDKNAKNEKFPMVVFSHGLGGSKDGFGELCDHLCSYGYVVVCPTHADSISERRKKGEKVTAANAFDIKLMDPEGRLNRMLDCRFILDSIPTLEEKIPALKSPGGQGKIDPERLAMAGHSAGAYTTEVLCGMKIAQVGALKGQELVEPRFKAAVVISGSGTNKLGITEQAWDDVKVPWLVITGSKDVVSISRETPESRQEPFKYARGKAKGGPPAYLVFIEGATHSSYAGKETSGLFGEKPTTDVRVIQNCVASSVLAFLDAHVKGDEKAAAWMEKGENMGAMSGGKARMESK